jgi:hypothetical protein
MRLFLSSVIALCVAAVDCDGKSSPAPTAPTPVAPIADTSWQGRWEGSYLYDRTEPAGCPAVGLTGPTCPTTPVPIVLTLTETGTAVSGALMTRIYGDAGPDSGPFPLTGRVDTASVLELTGEQPGGDPSCVHTTVRRMVSFTLRRLSAASLEGEFHFDGDRRSSSCFFFDVQVYGRDVRLFRSTR